MRELRCADAGLNCEGVIRADNDEEVMQQAASHVSAKHPDLVLDQPTQEQIRSLIHDA